MSLSLSSSPKPFAQTWRPDRSNTQSELTQTVGAGPEAQRPEEHLPTRPTKVVDSQRHLVDARFRAGRGAVRRRVATPTLGDSRDRLGDAWELPTSEALVATCRDAFSEAFDALLSNSRQEVFDRDVEARQAARCELRDRLAETPAATDDYDHALEPRPISPDPPGS